MLGWIAIAALTRIALKKPFKYTTNYPVNSSDTLIISAWQAGDNAFQF